MILRGEGRGVAVVRRNSKTKIETSSTNKFRLPFSGENRNTSESLRKIYKFQTSQNTQTTIYAVFSGALREISPKIYIIREHFIRNFQSS